MTSILIGTKTLAYELRPSSRARRVGLRVLPGGRIVVTTPQRMSAARAHAFVRKHARWLEKAYARMARVRPRTVLPRGKKDYAQNKMRGLALVRARVSQFNHHYGFKYNRISIKNQSSRWGSCSRKGNLNFSYQLVHLPPELADYIIVHELCHLVHFNHSTAFWNLVSKTMPHHRTLRKKLRAFAL